MSTPQFNLPDYRKAVNRGRMQAGIIGLIVVLIVIGADWFFEWRSNKDLEISISSLTRRNQQLKDENDKNSQTLEHVAQLSAELESALAVTTGSLSMLETSISRIEHANSDNLDFSQFLFTGELRPHVNDLKTVISTQNSKTQELKRLITGLHERAQAPDPLPLTVFTTNTGSKYHRADCEYLNRSKIPISLKNAQKQGLAPCGRCNPPTEED